MSGVGLFISISLIISATLILTGAITLAGMVLAHAIENYKSSRKNGFHKKVIKF